MLWRLLRRTDRVHDLFPDRSDPLDRDVAVGRSIRPRRGLPDGRAVVGGLLVAAATVGTWWVSTDAGRVEPARYLVAARPIEPGHVLSAADVRRAPMQLPPSVRAEVYTDVESIVGQVALGPIATGGLVQEGALEPVAGTERGREVSFAVGTEWAVDGALRPGDRIDVFATASTGEGATRRVLRSAVVRHVSTAGGGLGEATGLTITVAVADPVALEDAVPALRTMAITVVRSTGVIEAERTSADQSAHTAPTTEPAAPPKRTRSSSTTVPRPRARATTTTTIITPTGP